MNKTLIPIINLVKVRLPQRISLPRVSLAFSRDNSKKRIKPGLTLENGFGFLLEGGGRILIEREGSKTYPPAPEIPPILRLENGGCLLLEYGGVIKLETNHQ